MSLSLMEVYNFFNSKTNTVSEYMTNIKSIKKLSDRILTDYNMSVTNFSYNDTLNNLFFCLMYNKSINGYPNIENELFEGHDQYDRKIINLNAKSIEDCRNCLLEYINNDNFSINISKKKMIELITSNQYNHEIILILAHIYNINIFVFYKDINIFKVYYLEDKFNKNKLNAFLQWSTDMYSNKDTLQVMYIKNNKFMFDWSNISKLINDNITNLYAIGIEENKTFIIGESTEINIDNIVKQSKVENIVSVSDYILKKNEIYDVSFYNKIVSRS